MENGNHVTRAELKAHLDPMRSDIAEIKSDVKNLLLASTAQKAVAVETKNTRARKIALGSLAAASVTALVYVESAVAAAFH